MSCRLCQQDKPLCRSHVLPEFMYQGFYQEKHRFFGVMGQSARIELFQKGFRERLLCADCEAQFSRYEDHARRVFFNEAVLNTLSSQGSCIVSGNYRLLKLFLLSLIWRYGITNSPYLRGSHLGPHLQVLRCKLEDENPGGPLEYPCAVTAVVADGKLLRDIIYGPWLGKVDAKHIWNFIAGGFLFQYYVTNRQLSSGSGTIFLGASGSFRIGTISIEELVRVREAIFGLMPASNPYVESRPCFH